MTEPEPPKNSRRADLENLVELNRAGLHRLAQQGVGGLDALVTGTQLVTLVERLFGDLDDPRRLDYEEAVHGRLSTQIADIDRQAARARLLQGVNLNGRPPR